MLYAFVDGSTAIIGAADTLDEFHALTPEALSGTGANVRAATIHDMFSDSRLLGLSAALMLEFSDPSTITESLTRNGVTVVSKANVAKRQRDAKRSVEVDIFSDDRSIAEIFGLDKDDPWSNVEKSEQPVEVANAKKDGSLSGDSFDPKRKTDDEAVARVWDVKARAVNGGVEIDSAIAIKGDLGDGSERELGPNPYRVHTTDFAKVVRVDLMGVTVADVEQALTDESTSFERIAVAYGEIEPGDLEPDHVQGSWVACGLARLATRVADIVQKHHPDIAFEVYDINLEGERLLPKGIKSGVAMVTTVERTIGPRPWDENPAIYHTTFGRMPEKDRKARWIEEVQGGEFAFAGSWDFHTGTTVIVVPIAYWNREKSLYEEDIDLSHILPSDFKRVDQNTYQARSRDWNVATHALYEVGIRESLELRVHLNGLAGFNI